MSTLLPGVLPRFSLHVTGYANGGPRSYEDFRVAWSLVGGAEVADFRTAEWRHLRERGLAGVEYVRGASARDAAIWRARRNEVSP